MTNVLKSCTALFMLDKFTKLYSLLQKTDSGKQYYSTLWSKKCQSVNVHVHVHPRYYTYECCILAFVLKTIVTMVSNTTIGVLVKIAFYGNFLKNSQGNFIIFSLMTYSINESVYNLFYTEFCFYYRVLIMCDYSLS